jgi:hypothetical protein
MLGTQLNEFERLSSLELLGSTAHRHLQRSARRLPRPVDLPVANPVEESTSQGESMASGFPCLSLTVLIEMIKVSADIHDFPIHSLRLGTFDGDSSPSL